MEKLEFSSLCHMFQAQVKAKGKGRALLYKKGNSWCEYSWKEFQQRVFQVAKGLKKLGIAKGDRVCLLAENRPEWAFVDFGAMHLGALNVPIYATNIAMQVAYVIQDSEARVVFVSTPEQLEKIAQVEDQVPELQTVICFDLPKNGTKLKRLKVQGFEEFLQAEKKADPEDLQNDWNSVSLDDLATLIYTSGTTGNPKGVMLSHGNLLSNAIAARDVMSVEEDAVNFSFLPLSHALERLAGHYYPILAGMTIAYAESMEKIVDNLKEVKPTRFIAVPRILEKVHSKIIDKVEKSSFARKNLFYWALGVGKVASSKRLKGESMSVVELVQHQLADRLVFKKLRAVLGGRLRFLVSGGGPLAPEIGAFFDAVGIHVLQGYGLTETSPVCSCNHLSQYRFDTVGPPVPGVQIRIEQDGEILVKGPNVMQGYYKRPQDTREIMTEDGWLKTGDIGTIDPDGHLRITDRKKDIIVTAGGKNIAPQNIENKLKMDPYIEQVCVIGDSRRYISSLIVPNFVNIQNFAKEQNISFKDNADLIGKEEIHGVIQKAVDRVNAQLAPYESIKKFTLLSREFTGEADEITPTLKIKRKVVQQKYADLIERMY